MRNSRLVFLTVAAALLHVVTFAMGFEDLVSFNFWVMAFQIVICENIATSARSICSWFIAVVGGLILIAACHSFSLTVPLKGVVVDRAIWTIVFSCGLVFSITHLFFYRPFGTDFFRVSFAECLATVLICCVLFAVVKREYDPKAYGIPVRLPGWDWHIHQLPFFVVAPLLLSFGKRLLTLTFAGFAYLALCLLHGWIVYTYPDHYHYRLSFHELVELVVINFSIGIFVVMTSYPRLDCDSRGDSARTH